MRERQEIIGLGVLLLLKGPFQMRDRLVPFPGIEKGNPHIQHIMGLRITERKPGMGSFAVVSRLKQAIAQEPSALVIGGRAFQFCLQQTDGLGQVPFFYQLFRGICQVYRRRLLPCTLCLLRRSPRTFLSSAHLSTSISIITPGYYGVS